VTSEGVFDVYQERLRIIRERLEGINRDMTRDRRGGNAVPTIAHVKVLQAIVQVNTAMQLLDAEAARIDPTYIPGRRRSA
jgi:hypothetical protein